LRSFTFLSLEVPVCILQQFLCHQGSLPRVGGRCYTSLRVRIIECLLLFTHHSSDKRMHARICVNLGSVKSSRSPSSPSPPLREGMPNFNTQKYACFYRCYYIVIGITQYTQEARRSNCVALIDPHKLEHDGLHVHSRDPKVFHFCEAKCDHCGYYCTLPLSKLAR
jgi:hypothetical protein